MTESAHRPGPRSRPARDLLALTAVVAVVLAAISLVVASHASASSSPTRTLNVTGSGTVTGAPDTVTFQLGVTTVRNQATEALKVNNLRVKSLERALLAQGATKKNLQTSNFNIYQMTDQNGNLTGFNVSDTLEVTMHNIAKAGGAIDAAVAAVGNGVSFNGVSFSQSDQSRALASARTKAMKAAHAAAANLARAGDVTLGAPLKIVDQENQSSPAPYPFFPGAFATSGAATQTRLLPGTQSVTVRVSVTYQVNA
ncbi:MAG TPA: SIMPL domain-containing protein [Acidimicrobiales bacterium]|nr:SIMPL domain-containing protein [Acidimicrobiales bacterium]